MIYATQADLLERFGETELRQLSDNTSPRIGAINSIVVDRALADASAWIDSYLVGRYALPIADVAALGVLKMHCSFEARYLLMTVHADEAAIKAHDERLKWLLGVAKGDIVLIAPEAVPVPAGAGPVLFDKGHKVFGRDAVDGTGSDW